MVKGRQCLILLPQKIKLSAQMMVGLLLLVLLSTTLSQADSPNRVGLVVVHGNGEVVTRCIEFSEADLSGYEVLEQSGLDLNIDVNGGLGSIYYWQPGRALVVRQTGAAHDDIGNLLRQLEQVNR